MDSHNRNVGRPTARPLASMVIVWDIEEGARGAESILRFGDHLVWVEPARRGAIDRLPTVIGLLRALFGEDLLGVIPTPRAFAFLSGQAPASSAAMAGLTCLDGFVPVLDDRCA